MGIYFYKDTPVTLLFGSGLAGTNGRYSFSLTWTVDAAGAVRYVDLWNAASKNLGPYYCVISAN
jgi:hypothetical protein